MIEIIDCPTSCVGLKRVNDPGNSGWRNATKTGRIIRMVEKPRIPKTNQALVGLYKIKEVDMLIRAVGCLSGQ